MKLLKNLLFASLTVVALSMVYSCGEDDPMDTPQRPNTEKPDNGGNNGTGDNGTGDNGGNTGGETKPDPVVTFGEVVVSDITYNHAVVEVSCTLENVTASSKNKIVCRMAGLPEYLDLDQNVWGVTTLDKLNDNKLTVRNDVSVYPKSTFYARFDAEVDGKVFKSEVVTFQTPEKPYIPVTGITLSPTTMKLKVGDKEPLSATLSPKDATRKSVRWIYRNDGVAKSYSGVITVPAADGVTVVEALAPGETIVVGECTEGDVTYRAECKVVVEQ